VYDLGLVGKSILKEYLAYIENQDLSKATRHTKMMIVRSFFTWLKEAGFVAADPISGYRTAGKKDKEPRLLSEDEIKRLSWSYFRG
jgi:site-specific recombinase XerD